MAKKSSTDDEAKQLDEIKRLVVIAMFADDLLLERLVLKGGNALDLVHRISTRGSRDIDFSMQGEFSKDELIDIKRRIEASLVQTFAEARLKVFDVTMEEMPEGLTPDLADFWGGYYIHFKLIDPEKFDELHGEIEAIRRNALTLGTAGAKFEIDISKHEYVDQKEAQDLSGYRIFVYSPAMMVCEKLRAICQQMSEYGPVVKRSRPGAARARDFLDIHTLVTRCEVDMSENQDLLRHVFSAKRVPLSLLRLIPEYRHFHSENFLAVKDTVKPGIVLKSFEFYFDFVAELVSRIVF